MYLPLQYETRINMMITICLYGIPYLGFSGRMEEVWRGVLKWLAACGCGIGDDCRRTIICRGLPVTYTQWLVPYSLYRFILGLATEKVRLIKRLLSFVHEYFAVVTLQGWLLHLAFPQIVPFHHIANLKRITQYFKRWKQFLSLQNPNFSTESIYNVVGGVSFTAFRNRRGAAFSNKLLVLKTKRGKQNSKSNVLFTRRIQPQCLCGGEYVTRYFGPQPDSPA